MSKKPIGLIIITIFFGIAAATFATLFILQLVRSSDLKKAIDSQTTEIEKLKKEIDELKGANKQAANNYDAAKVIDAIEDNGNIGDHVRGKKDSDIVVVEYADLQCPGCASMMPYMSELNKEYGDRVAFVFRHYPLSYHGNAQPAAMATEAAAKQGYFWEMTEALYKKRTEWITISGGELTNSFVSVFEEIAPEGDSAQFKKDLDDANSKKKINFDTAIGRDESHVTATPTFFVNGEVVELDDIETLKDYADKIEELIQEQLK